MFKSNSGEPYAGKLHVRFLEEFISNCLIIREGENLLMRHRMEVKLTRTQEFDLYAFSEESLAEELNTENKEAGHVKDVNT